MSKYRHKNIARKDTMVFEFIKKYWATITSLILLIFVIVSVRQCYSYKNDLAVADRNAAALVDTVRTYKNKNGQLISTKLLLEGDLSDMKLLNSELYSKIKELGIKNPKTAIVYESVASLPQVDTCWVVKHDTITNKVEKDFSFNDEYRDLEGNVSYSNDTLGLNISKENVKMDYAVAVDKNNRVYITSSNPYVTINLISGYTIPKQKTKHFGIGPTIGYGYDIQHNKFSPYIGIGVSYNIIRF